MTWITCPICNARFDPQASKQMPFCSQRCQEIDLSRWLDERYGLPVETEEQNGEDEMGPDGTP